MSNPVLDSMLRPIETAPRFEVGQTVRILSGLDVNMPPELEHWLGAKCKVLQQIPSGLVHKNWAYLLEHPNGRTCEFKEDELDRRYRRKRSIGTVDWRQAPNYLNRQRVASQSSR